MILHRTREVNQIKKSIALISSSIKDDYPFYSSELLRITDILFSSSQSGFQTLNPVAFGELAIITKHLSVEPIGISIWTMIHPRIVRITKGLYLDGHYTSAANRSYVEVETRLRELFKELKSDANVPAKAGDLIGALLTDNGAYAFCDISSQSGKDYRKGIKLLFDGGLLAYRNPSSHENQDISKADAFEQIVLASQLMKVLDR